MNLANIKNKLAEELDQIGRELVQETEDGLRRHDLGDSDLFDSIEMNVEVMNTSMTLKLEMNDYWKWVENGRRSGKWPPLDKIRTWIDKKGLELQRNGLKYLPTTLEGRKRSLTFLIARSIGRNGIQPRPFVPEDPADNIRLRLEAILADAVENEAFETWKRNLEN